MLAASTSWIGALAGLQPWGRSVVWLGLPAVLVMLVLCRWRAAAAVLLLAAAAFGGHLAAGRDTAPDPIGWQGRVTFLGVAAGDPSGLGESGSLVVRVTDLFDGTTWISTDGPAVLVRGEVSDLAAGEPVMASGRVRPTVFRMRSGWVSGEVEAESLERLGESANPLMRIGNRLRRRVVDRLGGDARGSQRGLISGFLIGDVSALPTPDREALRLAGLSHFVAVSGSNVALFLGAWWVACGPLGWSPRRRAVAGLVGLGVFVVVTRWEPSVMRAAAMAALLLLGRLRGVVPSPWAALGWAITGLLAAAPALAADPGFQLSVAATLGILAGHRTWQGRRPGWLWTALGATVSAQVAVAPLLLLHFGSIPLFAPAANVVAAPLVATATIFGGVGALALPVLLPLADLAAWSVLGIARATADLPQVDAVTGALLAGAVAAVTWVRQLRPPATVVAAALLLVSAMPPAPPAGPEVSFLDVGQGDAALLRGPSGEVVLIDGGPDGAVLRAHLRSAGVDHVDLLVVSHRHADHTTGLIGLDVPIARMWHPPQLGEDSPLDAIVAERLLAGTVVEQPGPGTVARLGSFTLEVLGPLRRYESPNDGSLVVRVMAAGVSVLFAGDVEAVAQAELRPVPSDVLKVPHQGAATSDLNWLVACEPRLAVVSVGPNDFGHPSPAVIEALETAGAEVLRTDVEGTIRLRLDLLIPAAEALPSDS
ncbi:MAG: ComEC/Rec2 family competence protein [Acidimicrobiia bacterium]|nr:MAG: ComEC/Rec2 family competence protein [Acidimicrobiia bacterium]